MSITVTPIPRLTVLAVPAFTLGLANAAGSAESAVASDSTLLAFDTVLPEATVQFGQSGSAGEAVVTSRRDHSHAMASAATYGTVLLNSGNITSTTTSLIDVTGATVTLTTGARPCAFAAAFSWYQSTIDNIQFNVEVDGSTLLFGSNGLSVNSHAAVFTQNGSFTGQTAALSAASHTILLQWNVNAGTGTITAVSGYTAMWSVWEIL